MLTINRIVAGAEGVEQEDDPLGRRRLQNVETADVRKRFFAAQFRVQPAGLPRPPEEWRPPSNVQRPAQGSLKPFEWFKSLVNIISLQFLMFLHCAGIE